MKNKYFIKFGTILLLAVFISSCEKWIDPKINEDPDSVVDVPYNLLLPAIEVDLGYVIGGMDIQGNNRNVGTACFRRSPPGCY